MLLFLYIDISFKICVIRLQFGRCLMSHNFTSVVIVSNQGHGDLSCLVGYQAWHLIIGCHLFVSSTPTNDNAKDLSQYDSGC